VTFLATFLATFLETAFLATFLPIFLDPAAFLAHFLVWAWGAAVAAVSGVKKDARAFDVGGKIKIGGFGLVGCYYDGQNIGSAGVAGNTPLSGLFLGDAGSGNRDVKGGYGQATFKLPVGTTLGASYGISKVDSTSADTAAYGAALTGNYENKSYILGAYHPVTKHLNLVGEYTNTEYENVSNFKGYDGKAKTFALGAILFF